MKRYEINLEDTVAEFFEEISIIVEHPVEELISDVLFKQAETARQKVAELFLVDEE